MTPVLSALGAALLITGLASGCSSEDGDGGVEGAGASGNDATGTGGSGSAANATGGSNTTAPPPGPSADGWAKAYGGGNAKCSDGEDAFANLPHVTVRNSTIYVGYDQVSGNNQDPVVARFDSGEQVWCQYHEDDGPDGRALGITWDGGDHAYVVYSVVGGGTDLEGKGGWLGSYASGAISGGGPKVSVVGRVNAASGELQTATFIIAVTSDNKVNTHGARDAVTVLDDDTVEFLGESAHKAIDADGRTAMDCTEYPFDSRYRFSADLSELVCADCTNCTSQRPCE